MSRGEGLAGKESQGLGDLVGTAQCRASIAASKICQQSNRSPSERAQAMPAFVAQALFETLGQTRVRGAIPESPAQQGARPHHLRCDSVMDDNAGVEENPTTGAFDATTQVGLLGTAQPVAAVAELTVEAAMTIESVSPPSHV